MATIDYKQKIKDYMNSSEVDTLYKSMLNNLFPELAESEDGRMVKFIKNQLFNIKKTITENYELDAKLTNAIDWLEKQGEKERVIAPKFSIGDTIRNKTTNEVFTITNRCVSLEYYCDINHSHEVKFSEQDDWELIEQKPVGFNIGDEVTVNGQVCRVVAVDKDAWSEEDENLFRCAIDAVEQESKVRTDGCLDEEVGKMVTDWLKSLKERYTWKPSDKQMHYLSWIANIKLGDSMVEQEVSKHLNELLEDLKKLKG